MRLIRLDPWRDFGSLQDRVNKMFGDTLRTLYPQENEELERGAWAPAVDIHETDDGYVVKADLPGMKKEDIQIDLKDSTLQIKGEKKFEEEASRDNYIRTERAYGTFVRSFSLPHNIDAGKIKASYKDGVLELALPKKEEAKPKQIKVEVN